MTPVDKALAIKIMYIYDLNISKKTQQVQRGHLQNVHKTKKS